MNEYDWNSISCSTYCYKKIFALSLVLALLVFSTGPNPALAACDVCDAPDCVCFDDTGAWDAGGSPFTGDYIQEVALDTVGTQESCNCSEPNKPWRLNSGKPYYSIVLGSNSEDDALAWASMEAAGITPVEGRQAWCSETISYWHREAGIPYQMGYGKRPVWNWLQKSVLDIKTWYELEEALDDGRGRWIDAQDLDYNDFRPGINAPLPGAYVSFAGCKYFFNEVEYYKFEDVGHSLMIDEMSVHRDSEGRVFQVEVSFLEGNSRDQVRGPGNNQREWDDLISYTPQGAQAIYWHPGDDEHSAIDDIRVKVYGFGIDLDESGNPIYDASKLHYVDHGYPRPISLDPITVHDQVWDAEYAPRVKPLKQLDTLLNKNSGPDISCSSEKLKLGDLPNGDNNSWIFPQGGSNKFNIVIDYLAPNPMPLQAVRMDWNADFIPSGVEVLVKDNEGKAYDTQIPDFSKYTPSKMVESVPMTAHLSKPVTDMRFIALVFPEGTFDQGQGEMVDFSLSYDEGPYGDAETPHIVPVFVDIRPGVCPNSVEDIKKDKIDIALLGSGNVDARNILDDTVLLNGKSVQVIDKEYKDVSTPFIGSAPKCHSLGPDGHTDLVLSFHFKEFVATLKPDTNVYFEVRVDGTIKDQTGNFPFVGQDFIDMTKHVPSWLYLLLDN